MRGLWVSLAETHTSAAYTALADAYLSELAVVGRVSILVQGGAGRGRKPLTPLPRLPLTSCSSRVIQMAQYVQQLMPASVRVHHKPAFCALPRSGY